ncbi:unnamed protein product, partial [Closterium sp. Naga37s-1]
QQRRIFFNKARNCTDPFPLNLSPRPEPCDCTPEDYERKYVKADNGSCTLSFQPTNCEGGDSTWEIPADPLFCELAPVPCGEGNIRTIHGKCDYIRDPASNQPLSKEKTIQVIYYFDSGCNPTAHGSLPLPSPGYIPC